MIALVIIVFEIFHKKSFVYFPLSPRQKGERETSFLKSISLYTSSSQSLYLETSENLVDKELNVVICKLLAFHNVVQICPHEMGHQVPKN